MAGLEGVERMSAIGAVEDAYAAAADAVAELDNAVDCAEGEGFRTIATFLRVYRAELDDLANRIGHERAAMRERLRA